MQLLHNNFDAGELSRKVDGRIDLPEYYRACRTLENFVSEPSGGATKRPGFEHIYAAYSASYASRVIGFVNKTDRYILEFSQYKMRVFKDGDIVLDGASPYVLTTPWTAAEAAELVFAPGGTAIFHGDHDLYELTCDGDTDWTLTAFASPYGPFLKANADTSLTMTPSATSGAGKTLTCNEDYFEEGHIGSLFELTHDLNEVSLVTSFDNRRLPPFTQNETGSAVTIKGRYDIKIVWHGWGKLKLQRCSDDVNWQTVKTWDKPIDPSNDMTIKEAGQEDDDGVQYRFYIDWAFIGDPDVLYDSDLLIKWYWLFNPPNCLCTIKAKNTSQSGIARITDITTAKIAVIDILNDFGSTQATHQWREGAWSPKNGYPKCGTIHEQRIMAANTDLNPKTIWCARPFLRQGDDRLFYGGSTVEDDDAFWREISLEDCNAIMWLASMWPLLIGADASVIKGIGASPDSPMTPANTNFLTQSGMGSSSLQPVRISGRLVYAARDGKSLFEMSYSDDQKTYTPLELTRYRDHICGSGIAGWALQQRPIPILWAWTIEGELLGMTRCHADGEHDPVLAFHRHPIDGTVESGAVIPNDDYDEFWISTARTVNGSTVRAIERMKPFDWGDSQRDCFFVDAGTTWDGGAAATITGIAVAAGTGKVTITATGHGFSDGYKVKITSVAGMTDLNNHVYTVSDKTDDTFILKTRDASAYINGSTFGSYVSGGSVERVANSVTGLTQLAGEAVAILLDGQPATGLVNTSGVYTVGTHDRHYHNTIHVGRAYTAKLSPMRPQVNTPDGSVQAKFKKIVSCGIRLYQSAGGRYGTSEDDAQPIIYAERGDAVGADVEVTTKDCYLPGPGGWQKEGDIYIESSDPLPMTVSAILFGMET